MSAGALFALAACGGGGGGGGGGTPSAPANPPVNQAPVAKAGADQTVEFPLGATLQGSATDDGAVSALTYAWSAATGGVTFASPGSATTDVTFPSAGSYELTLTVNDGTTTGTDNVVVTVSPAVYPAADDDTQPDRGWTRVAAADVGMNQAKLDEASTYALTGGGSGIILRRGRLVHSWGDIDQRYDLKSTTKSMGGIALSLAIDEARVALGDLAKDRLPEIGNPPVENVATGWLPLITIEQLATHTAGFKKPGDYQPLEYQPGTTWQYSDCGLNWLADLLTNVYGEDLSTLMTRRVWSVLGLRATDLVWRNAADGLRPAPQPIEHRELASGIIANTNAMARVGLLYLRKGMWADQRILSESVIETAHTPQAAAMSTVNSSPTNFPGAPSDYGVLWWTNIGGQLANVPRDAYWAWGLGESLIVVIPSLDLVIVRAGPQVSTDSAGRVWNDRDWNGDYAVLTPFFDPIVQSITP